MLTSGRCSRCGALFMTPEVLSKMSSLQLLGCIGSRSLRFGDVGAVLVDNEVLLQLAPAPAHAIAGFICVILSDGTVRVSAQQY